MADGANVGNLKMALVEEVTRGTTPGTPAFVYIPVRPGSSASVEFQDTEGQLITGDRQPADSVSGPANSSANIQTSLVRETGIDKLLESLMSDAWTTLSHGAVAVVWAASGKTATRATGSWLTDAPGAKFEVGDLLFAAGTAANQTQLNGALNSSTTTITLDTVDATTVTNSGGGYAKIDNEIISFTGRTSTSLTGVTRGALGTTAASHLDNAPVLIGRTITAISALVLTFGGDTIADESSVSTTFTTPVQVLNLGSTRKFFTLEENYTDINIYRNKKGIEVNSGQFDLPTNGEIGLTFAMVGTEFSSGQESGATYTAVAGRTPFAASTNGNSLLSDYAALGTCFTSFQFTVDNGRKVEYGVGEDRACFVSQAPHVTINLNFSAYLVDNTLYDKFINKTRFRLMLSCVNESNAEVVQLVFPRVKIGQFPVQAQDNSFVEQATARAERDATAGTAFYLRRSILA